MNPFLNTVDRPPVQIAQSGSNAVTAGGDLFGWVSGDIASLAASAAVNVIFDLGPLWRAYNICSVCVFMPAGASSGLSGVQVSSADTPAFNVPRRLRDCFQSSTASISASISPSTVEYFFKPMGRYLVVNATNADTTNAVGATATITVAAYPC